MIYYLFKDYFNIVQYISFRATGAAITALIICFLIGPKIIRTLVIHNFSESIRKNGPISHQIKEGTPSMGGIIIILSILSLINKKFFSSMYPRSPVLNQFFLNLLFDNFLLFR